MTDHHCHVYIDNFEDAAEGTVDALKRYDNPAPVHLGTGNEISIRDLVHEIADVVGFEDNIEWDTSKPDGQPQPCLETSRAEKKFSLTASTPFQDRHERTVAWYEQHRPLK